MPFYIIIGASLVGFSIALYINTKKRRKQEVACPLHAKCENVIYSKYAKFAGIPIELLGILYYGFLILSYAIFAVSPELYTPIIKFLFAGITLSAALFSTYLTLVQAITLKEWCSWCLFSAGISMLILLTVFFALGGPFAQILAQYKEVIEAGHLLSLALGLGGATIADILLLRFLKDRKITQEESGILHTVTQVVWGAMGLLVLTGLGIYLPDAYELNHSSIFISRVSIFVLLSINVIVLSNIVIPRLLDLYSINDQKISKAFARVRRFAFSLEAISIVSWYSLFVLTIIKKEEWSISVVLYTYVILVILAMGISLRAEQKMRQ